MRNPSSEALDNLVVKIFQFKIYTSEARGYLDKTRKSLTDFRNKFNQNILNLVGEYKEIRKSRYLFILLFYSQQNSAICIIIN